MVTANNIYTVVCQDLWEPNGLQLGILSVTQFISILNQAILDMVRDGCPEYIIDTQTVLQGQSQYAVADNLMRVDNVFLGGVLLEMSWASSLPTGNRQWRNEEGTPQAWHANELPVQVIELDRPPNYNGAFIPGPTFPNPPDAQQGSFDIIDNTNTKLTPDQHQDLTMVGPQLPTTIVTLTDTIPILADDFALGYLGFGVLWRIYSSDSENRDLARAEWAKSQFDEGVMILKQIGSEAMLES